MLACEALQQLTVRCASELVYLRTKLKLAGNACPRGKRVIRPLLWDVAILHHLHAHAKLGRVPHSIAAGLLQIHIKAMYDTLRTECTRWKRVTRCSGSWLSSVTSRRVLNSCVCHRILTSPSCSICSRH